jgi:cell division protein FtsI/penicillin-binding protein 2
VLHDTFVELGYGAYPNAGLGGERRGDVPELPWRTHNQHASVSFGHELMVTLWQQAAALATVVRGGEFRPLRLVDAIEQSGVRHPVPLAEPRRIFGADACAKVREMMFMGAREGTGKKVYCDGIEMGTKTGTAQKVPGEVCLHVELAHNRDHKCRGARACRAKLKGAKDHKSSCYTSSMCIFGKLRRSESDIDTVEREIMVLVVVDEPRGGKKYGSDVAGPAAAGILKEALGYTRDGVRVEPLPEDGFAPLDEIAASELAKHFQLSDAPWSEVAGASH